jgi:hypothetical protein
MEKIECVYSLYDKMRRKWDDVYLRWGLLNIYHHSFTLCYPFIFVYPVSLPDDGLGGCDRGCLERCLDTGIE